MLNYLNLWVCCNYSHFTIIWFILDLNGLGYLSLIYSYTHTYIHTYIYTHPHIYTYIYTYIQTYIYTHIHTHTHTSTHIYIYIYIYMCINTHTYLCTHIYVHVIYNYIAMLLLNTSSYSSILYFMYKSFNFSHFSNKCSSILVLFCIVGIGYHVYRYYWNCFLNESF